MKKLKKIIYILFIWILVGMGCCTSMYCYGSTNSVNLFSGEATASISNVAATIVNSKNCRCIDTKIMNEDGYFYAEYTGDKDAIRLVLQSWSGGEEWVTIKPSETGTTEDGCYYAKFYDETLRLYYKQDYSTIDQIHIWAVDGTIVLKSMDYIIEEKSYLPTENNVKSLGRTYFYNDALWLALSGSGAEYTFNGTECEVTILGDNVSQWGVEGLCPRIAIYVNEEKVIDTLISDKEVTFKVFESEEPKDVKVRIIKLSEASYSTVGIKSIKLVSTDGIKPSENKQYTLEFVGDSITCGYGVDDEDPTHHFSTATEDVTKTYGYKCAEMLDADYSFVCYSGYGVISGYTSNGDKEENGVICNVYDKIGKSYGSFNEEIDPSSIYWDFDKINPDIIVINLGTNDYSYFGDDEDRINEFINGYVNMLKFIRSKNPEAKILCTIGMLGDGNYVDIQKAAELYRLDTGDENIACMKFDIQSYEDGYCSDYHPTEKTHTKAAEKLANEIRRLMGL